jgi:alpha-amylase/alpha-mannosidase (GH57 family)
MKNVTLAFLWHMHQPYYRDMVTGESTMPWVRLHGIHSYYDMLRLYRAFPNMQGTINFVPSLVEQLLAYTEFGESDVFLDHTLVPAEELTPQQKVFLLRHFFMANHERKIEPYGPYQKLLLRLGTDRQSIDYNQAVRFFSTQEYLDLQVFYNLVWFGFAAKEEIPELKTLLSMGGHFSEENKKFVIDAQKKILGNLLVELRNASVSDNVEISTTPYYHPILPLLINTGIAHRANARAPLPPMLSAPSLAKTQIRKALDAMETWTGKRPSGMWPSEGSVCPEAIPFFANAGISWIATDDEILKKSLGPERTVASTYQPFTATHDGKSVSIVFRDHHLSDLIGFTYSKMPAQKAVEDFIAHLRKISSDANGEKRLVTVVLDGENPWEHYPDAGREFLYGLFEALGNEGVTTSPVGKAIENHPPTLSLENLASGSWINANFDIWIGKAQKNQGWDYIRRTLEDTESKLTSSDPMSRRALESLCAATGSDWFWWFDDDFDSAFKGDFDRIFRGHLKNTYALLGMEIPLFLFDPIYRFRDEREALLEPPGFIEPVIDGTESSFFEWSNASVMTVHGRSSGAMAYNSTDPFETLSFGFNPKAFYIRIDPVDRSHGFSIGEDDAVKIGVHSKGARTGFNVTMKDGTARIAGSEPGEEEKTASGIACSARDVLELGFEFSALKLSAGDSVTVTITLNRRNIEVRRYSHINFKVPDENYELQMWSV